MAGISFPAFPKIKFAFLNPLYYICSAMYLEFTNSVFVKFQLSEESVNTSHMPVSLIRDWFFYIGVQMTLPFRKDKKSGVTKFNRKNCIPKKSGSHKSVVNCVKTTTLQLGARGETIE